MKKALVIGIDNYPSSPLSGCVNDAETIAKLLQNNEDGKRNFDVRLLRDIQAKRDVVIAIRELFQDHESDSCLLYFAGHGTIAGGSGWLVTPDYQDGDEGISTRELLQLANVSPSRNRIIILDCCHAGKICSSNGSSSEAFDIRKGTTILAACNAIQSAEEENGRGVFSSLLGQALEGGAATIDGKVTPAGIYAYIDRSLGAWDQRPLFATNTSEVVSVRECKPLVELDVIRNLPILFHTADSTFSLDPSYEFTNTPNERRTVSKPYASPEHVQTFKQLQSLNKVGLIRPNGTEHMYFAAMESKSCSLTPLGKHYWRRAKNNLI